MKRTLIIKGKTWKIKRKKNLKLKGVGACNGVAHLDTREIHLDSKLTGEPLTRTLLHEIMHAIVFELHLKEHGGIDDAIEEVLCDGAADILLSLFEIKI